VPVIVLREGKTETLQVTLGRREDAEAVQTMPASATAPETPSEMETLGLTLRRWTMRCAIGWALTGSAEGLIVLKVDPASEAYTKGLVEGDLITEAGQQHGTCGCRT
jgi:serine protease Do